MPKVFNFEGVNQAYSQKQINTQNILFSHLFWRKALICVMLAAIVTLK